MNLEAHLGEAKVKLSDINNSSLHNLQVEGVGGITKAAVIEGIFKGQLNSGKEVFIFKYPESRKSDALESMTSSRILDKLGLGPKASLIREGSSYLVVFEFAPGINIKEVLFEKTRTEQTWPRIKELLGETSGSLEGDLKLLANKILHDGMTTETMYKSAMRLRETGVHDPYLDIQFMVNPGKSKPAMIDADSIAWKQAKKYDPANLGYPKYQDPVHIVGYYIKALQRMADGLPAPSWATYIDSL